MSSNNDDTYQSGHTNCCMKQPPHSSGSAQCNLFFIQMEGGEMFHSALQRLSFLPSCGSTFVQSLDVLFVQLVVGGKSEQYALEMFMGQTWRSPHYIHLILWTGIRSHNHTLVRGRLKIQSRLDGWVKKRRTQILVNTSSFCLIKKLKQTNKKF